MQKKFKSVNRAIKRGHLDVKFREVPTGKVNTVNGTMEFRNVPYLVRKVRGNNKKSTLGRQRVINLNGGHKQREVYYSQI